MNKGIASFEGVYEHATAPTIQLGEPAGTALKIAAIKASVKPGSTIGRRNRGNGVIAGYRRNKIMRTITVEAVVRADTAANAALALAEIPELTKVTLANFVSAGDVVFNGEWICEAGSEVAIGEDEEAKHTFEAFQFFTDAGVLIDPDTLLATIS